MGIFSVFTAMLAVPQKGGPATSFKMSVEGPVGYDRRSFATALTSAGVGLAAASATPFAAAAASPVDGEYWDPFHPRGLRTVRVSGDTVTVAGKDEPDGPTWKLTGAVDKDENLLIDFSPKGGPKDLLGKYVNKLDSTGIVFPDGNRWSKAPAMAGLYSDPNHPNGYRVVTVYPVGFGSGYQLAACYGQDEPGGKPFKLVGKLSVMGTSLGPDTIAFDFSPKGGPSSLIAKFDGSGFVFPDGNRWPKVDLIGN